MIKHRFLKALSKIWPWPIYIGTSLTVDDNKRNIQKEFKEKFNRRVCRTTAKFYMEPEFAVFEIVNITIDQKQNSVMYSLEHCATGATMNITEDVFKILFSTLKE